MSDDLIWKTAAELGALYRAKQTSPQEVIEAVVARMDEVDSALNVMVTTTADSALEEARAATERFRRGEDLPPLFGIPITVKDLTDTAGVRTTYGCVAYAEHVPEHDAIAWQRLKKQGVILLGKTTTPEFGLLGVTESKLTGATGNPWDPTRNAGGSSGGAAAAVAAGVGPLAWGSDGGGSIRVPASLCGVVGIKPSIGRIAHAHNQDSDSTEGPLARTTLDAAMLLDATVGPHPLDRIALPTTGERFADEARNLGDLSGYRLAACADLGQRVLDPDVRRVFNQALDDLRSAGATVEFVEISLPDTFEYFDHYNGPEYVKCYDDMIAAGIDVWPLIADIARRGRMVTGAQAAYALRGGKTAIYEAFTGAMQGFDAMVTPTTPIAAQPHFGDYGPTAVIENREVQPMGLFLHTMTEPPSHAGLPAMSVPAGFTAVGLPVGLQIVGPLYADALVVRLAARYEAASTWNTVRPGLQSSQHGERRPTGRR